MIHLIVLAITMFIVDLPWLVWSRPHWMKLAGAGGGQPLAGIPVYLAMAYLFGFAKSVGQAAAIGLAAYAIFDGTNAVLFGKYPIWLAVADTLWGGLLFAIVYLIKEKFKF